MTPSYSNEAKSGKSASQRLSNCAFSGAQNCNTERRFESDRDYGQWIPLQIDRWFKKDDDRLVLTEMAPTVEEGQPP
jgi:hypothetical protein